MTITKNKKGDFYPRPPRGGRQPISHSPLTRRLFLSTPSARRATSRRAYIWLFCSYFYPRPPRGGRLVVVVVSTVKKLFLSTPSARRATGVNEGKAGTSLFLSTPSARRATDLPGQRPSPRRDFYPRPPRGGRHRGEHKFCVSMIFLSTPSARRATSNRHPFYQLSFYFYPRPPRGGRRLILHGADVVQPISIHALREEGDR